MTRWTRAFAVACVCIATFLVGYLIADIGVLEHSSSVRLAGHLVMLVAVLGWFATMVRVLR